MIDDAKLTEEPQDRLTRLCDAMTDTLERHREYRDDVDKCCIFIQDGEQGGMVLHGYTDSVAAIADLLQHLQAIFKANGKKLDIMFMDDDGIDRVDG